MAEFPELVQKYRDITNSVESVTASRFQKGSILRYPLNNQEDYGGTITFMARKLETTDLITRAKKLLSDLTEVRENTDAIQALANEKRLVEFTQSNVDATVKPEMKNIGTGRKCTMYLPASVQVQDRVTYSNTDLGLLGAGVRAGVMSGQTGGEILGGAFNQFKETGASIIDLLFGGTSVSGQETAQIAAMRLLPGTASGAISSATGIALNPNKRALLSGPEIRAFTFTFKMIPTSQAEAESIEKIIQYFREEMYPDKIEQFGISAAYRYPSIFDIIMRYRTSAGKYKKVATGILPCFLQSVDVNYNQSGMSFHRDGRPQEANLTLVFTEERALNREDVIKGF
tara:strand:+ start:7438 stop:8466 length:1029 start_codon:yes stop_codon:yes gene_type:complete